MLPSSSVVANPASASRRTILVRSLFAAAVVAIMLVVPDASTRGAEGGGVEVGSCAESALRGYESSGAYLRNHEQLLEAATFYLRAVVGRYDNPAIVFDVDETTLSNFDFFVNNGFCLDIDGLTDYWNETTLPALAPSLALYNVARANGVTVFFITGRREVNRTVTEANLAAVGYNAYEQLYLKPNDFTGTTVEYKSARREEIINMGYEIMLNVGDQFSDLDGGFADRTLLVPNPFYFVP